MVVGLKRELLLGVCRIDKKRTAMPALSDDPTPDVIANAGRNIPHKNSGANLKKPLGEVTTQSRRHCG